MEEQLLDLPASDRRAPDFKRWLFIVVIVVVCLGLVGGGVYVYTRAMKGKGSALIISSVNTTPTPAPEVVEATPTPEEAVEEELDVTALSIQVQNGSGVTGAAGKVVALLEGLGYEDVKTGNADSYDYTETIIKIKEDKKNYLVRLEEDLGEKYTLGETETLVDTSAYDVVVILGKE